MLIFSEINKREEMYAAAHVINTPFFERLSETGRSVEAYGFFSPLHSRSEFCMQLKALLLIPVICISAILTNLLKLLSNIMFLIVNLIFVNEARAEQDHIIESLSDGSQYVLYGIFDTLKAICSIFTRLLATVLSYCFIQDTNADQELLDFRHRDTTVAIDERSNDQLVAEVKVFSFDGPFF